MEFNNLRRNILAILGEEWQKSESNGKISLHPVRSEFSDLPESDLENYIESLARDGYIMLSDDRNRAKLTGKGISRLTLSEAEKSDAKMVVVDQLG